MNRDIQRYRTRLQDHARAEKYALRFESGSRRRIDRREQRAVGKIFGSLDGCRSVLDVPSGAGRFVGVLGHNSRRVLELDAAREILEFARQRAGTLGVSAQFMQGDASRLPLAGDSVDAVFCNRLLHHILPADERAAILRELRRVSRRYVVVSFFDYRRFARLRGVLKALKGKKPSYEGQPTLEQFQAEVSACGFRIKAVVLTATWASQKFLVLEKA